MTGTNILKKMNVQLKRLDDAYHFEACNEDGQAIHLDNSPEHGGHKKGVRPMQTLLMALGGCSAIDIVTILKKQRQTIEDFQISIDGEREKDQVPSLFETIHIVFKLKGKLDKDKVERAVALSMEKYCSVAKTLEKTAKITYKIEVRS